MESSVFILVLRIFPTMCPTESPSFQWTARSWDVCLQAHHGGYSSLHRSGPRRPSSALAPMVWMISSQPHRPMLTLQEPLVGPGFHIGASKIVGAVAVARHNMIQYFCHFGHIPKFPDSHMLHKVHGPPRFSRMPPMWVMLVSVLAFSSPYFSRRVSLM